MTIFDHYLWSKLKPYARLTVGRDNLDLLQLPDGLRAEAMTISLPCVACGESIRVFRARMKSKRSRIAEQVEERRLFYAATCPSAVNAGCSRSRAAKGHKKILRERLGQQRERRGRSQVYVEVHDASGKLLYAVMSDMQERFEFDLPSGATTIALVPA